jgi:hypothetical protein
MKHTLTMISCNGEKSARKVKPEKSTRQTNQTATGLKRGEINTVVDIRAN